MKIFRNLISLIVIFGVWRVNAAPTEGLEAFRLFSTKKGSGRIVYILGQYTNPTWTSDYEALQSYISWVGPTSNTLTAGAMSTIANQAFDRTGYFVRYDWAFLGQSFGFKFAHVDYRYLGSGKNTLSASYNVVGNIGKFTHLYFTFGPYYRYSLNRWNAPTWSPLNFNTEDKEWFVEVCFGSKWNITQNFKISLDVNNRDAFYSYNGDYLAMDFIFDILSKGGVDYRMISSSRFSSWLAGTGDIAEQTFILGLVIPN